MSELYVENSKRREKADAWNQIKTDLKESEIRMQEEGGIISKELRLMMITQTEALAIFDELRQQASSVPEMSINEINDEIAKVRAAGKTGKIN